MIICKRPAPLDDHLQEAAPSGGGAYGQRSTGHFTTLGRIVEEKKEEKEEEEEKKKEKEEKKKEKKEKKKEEKKNDL